MRMSGVFCCEPLTGLGAAVARARQVGCRRVPRGMHADSHPAAVGRSTWAGAACAPRPGRKFMCASRQHAENLVGLCNCASAVDRGRDDFGARPAPSSGVCRRRAYAGMRAAACRTALLLRLHARQILATSGPVVGTSSAARIWRAASVDRVSRGERATGQARCRHRDQETAMAPARRRRHCELQNAIRSSVDGGGVVLVRHLREYRIDLGDTAHLLGEREHDIDGRRLHVDEAAHLLNDRQ